MEDGGTPAASWYHAFGVHAASGVVTYLDDNNVLYPVGRHLVINDPMDLKDKEGGNVEFIPVNNTVAALAVSMDKGHVAVLETVSNTADLSADKQTTQISIFKLERENGKFHVKKRKLLHLTDVEDVSFENIVSIAWAADHKHLAIQTGTPDWALIYWNTQTNKMVTWSTVDEAVARLSGHPDDMNQIVSTGPNLLRVWNVSKDNKLMLLKPSDLRFQSEKCSWTAGATEEFTDHIWLPPADRKEAKENKLLPTIPRLLVGTSQGNLLIFENFELITVITDYWKDSTVPGAAAAAPSPTDNVDLSVASIAPLKAGFVVANASGFMFFFSIAGTGIKFQRKFNLKAAAGDTEVQQPYVLIQRLCVKDPMSLSSTPDYVPTGFDNELTAKQPAVYACTMSANPEESALACVFSDGQVGSFDLDDVDMKGKDSNPFNPVAGGCHVPGMAVLRVDTCLRQPLAVTCSEDNCIRVWEIEKRYCAVSKQFMDPVYCVSIHPSGLHIVAGFSDKIRLFNVMIKDLKCFAELPEKMCREVRFSNGGDMFAAVYQANIVLYSTFSFERLGVLTGHISMVSSLAWSADDKYLLSAGQDGAVYEWEIYAQDRRFAEEAEPVRKLPTGKPVKYSHAIFAAVENKSADGIAISDATVCNALACGNDNIVRQLSKGQTTDERNVDADVTQLVLSKGGNFLFVALANGLVRVYDYPFMHDRPPQEYHTHAGAIRGMALSGDGQFLVTAGADSAVYVLAIHEAKAVDVLQSKQKVNRKMLEEQMQRDGFDVALVVRTEMMKMDDTIDDLHKQIKAVKEEHIVELVRKQSEWGAQNADGKQHLEMVKQELMAEVARLKEQIKHDRRESEALHESAEDVHRKALIELEKTYHKKLSSESVRLQELDDEKDDMLVKFKTEFERQEARKLREKQEMVDEMESLKEEHERILSKNGDDVLMMKMSFDEHLRQMENEYEREVEELQVKFDLERSELQDQINVMAQGNSIATKKIQEAARESAGLTSSVEVLRLNLNEATRDIEEARMNCSQLRHELAEREESLGHKDKFIVELKNKIRDLEKLKFVQDYQLLAMKAETEPRTQELERVREHQFQLDQELEEKLNDHQKIEQSRSQLRMQIEGQQREVRTQRDTIKKKERFIALFSQDLQRIVMSLDPAEWQQPVQALFRKYVEGRKTDSPGHIAEIESALETQAREWGRQRDFSEKRLSTWQQKAALTSEKARYLNNQRIAENSALLIECNDLRIVNKTLQTQVGRMQAALKGARLEAAAAKRMGGGGGSPDMRASDDRGGQAGGWSSSGVRRPGTAGSVSSNGSRQTAASTVFTYRSAGQSRASTPDNTMAAKGGGGASGMDTSAATDPGLPPSGAGRLYKGRTGIGAGPGRPVSAGPAMMLPEPVEVSGSGGHRRPRSADGLTVASNRRPMQIR